ncbi:1361_t:CDS:2 [Cetraspora pellucida]|uniref:1361_t:CDS:1 n=1 Tax=Cetraspora pellucida TaxID=1433469 RepID=A0A9N9D629_9GLOM|nr:1361_t:CDS:2 [Cetraspora pellucida]
MISLSINNSFKNNKHYSYTSRAWICCLLDAKYDDEGDEEGLPYDLYDLENAVLTNFKDSKDKNAKVEFSIIVKIEKELVNKVLLSEFDYDKEVENSVIL